jgi:hypothetical protein
MQGENHPFTNVEPEGHVISKHEGDPKWKKNSFAFHHSNSSKTLKRLTYRGVEDIHEGHSFIINRYP